MNNIRTLSLAYDLMKEANRKHKHEIFMDVNLDEDDEVITFDILPSNMDHVSDLTRLLNLTFNFTPGNELRKTVYFIS